MTILAIMSVIHTQYVSEKVIQINFVKDVKDVKDFINVKNDRNRPGKRVLFSSGSELAIQMFFKYL